MPCYIVTLDRAHMTVGTDGVNLENGHVEKKMEWF